MKEKFSIVSSIIVLLLTFNACGNGITRDSDGFSKDYNGDGSDRKIESPKSGEEPVVDSPLNPISSTPSIDNNDSTSVVKIDATNAYKLSMTLSKNKFQQGESGTLEYSIKELYTNNILDNSKLEKVKLSLPDKRYAKFVDFQGTETDTFLITDNVKAQDIIRLKMGKNSGTTEIVVSAIVRLSDGKTYELKNTIPVVVMENVAASIAVNSYGTKFIKTGDNAGLFVEDYVFHIVDTHGDKAKDGTYLQAGVINDPKVYTLGIDPDKAGASDIREMRSYSIDTSTFILNATGQISREKIFKINSTDINLLNKVDIEDKVVVLPNKDRNDPTYLGSWSIKDINKSNNEIILNDDYTGNKNMNIEDTSGLTFVIGDEDRYNPCSHTLANAAFYFPNDNKVKDGVVHAQLRYQPFMVGKSVFVYANAIVNGERVGIAREIHLLGEGISSERFSCSGTTKEAVSCGFDFGVKLNGYEDFARDLTPSYTFKGDTPSNIDTSRLNTGCGGYSHITVTMDINKSVSFDMGGSIWHENIINQK